MKIFNKTGSASITSVLLLVLLCIPVGASSASWSLEAAPSVLLPDTDFFGADLSPGISAGFGIEINSSFRFKQRFGYYYAEADPDNFEIFNTRFFLDYFPLAWNRFRPVVSAGIALVTANPPAASGSRKSFRPSQTVFFLSCGAGAEYSGISENIDISAMMTVLASPYRYRKYYFDSCNIVYEEAQFTHALFSVAVIYGF